MKARVFGAGSIGNHLTHALIKRGFSVEVVDIDKSSLLRMRDEIYPLRYGTWDDSIKLLLEPTQNLVDLEVIGTPPDIHSKILLEGINLNRSKAWLVEKPFTYPDLDHINDLKNKLVGFEERIFVGYNHSVTPPFITFLKAISKKNNVTRIYCNWLEHWGGIFKAHPWLKGPEDSYLGFYKRGGGSLMEHSHGLHILLLVINNLGLKINNTSSSVKKDQNGNYDEYVNIVFNLEGSFGDLIATYTTDVLTKDTSKKIVVETEDEIFSVEFGGYNGSSDIFRHVCKNNELKTIYKKNRPDDFKYEISLLGDMLEGGNSRLIGNLSCKWGIEISSLCSTILNH